ncbi:MAG: UDP-N-acetylmuramoyl-L-alanyl-D-glutamate--2,6-diaminopimelate ligase [Candidatus Bruticola sp.]
MTRTNVAELSRLIGSTSTEVIGDLSTEISGLSCDSRQVKSGDLFVCVTGFQCDGHAFAADALEKGAAALVVEHIPDGVPSSGVTIIKTNNTRRALAKLSAAYFGNPAKKLVNVGVTGTNGKTTTTYLIEAILKKAGFNPGMLGTIEAHVAGEKFKLANTTPESFDLHKMFAKMLDAGQDSLVMEVSSHALALDRVYGIPYDIAVFTNLTQDHLDFHLNMENYFLSKAKLFTRLGTYGDRKIGPFAVINLDDPYGVRLIEMVKGRVPVITYGTSCKADVRAYDVKANPSGLSFTIETRVGEFEVNLPLSGLFNLHNALAAAAVGMALRIDGKCIVKGLESVAAVPGRFQLVRKGQNFTVIVDYAHSPDGLSNLLDSARMITKGKLTLVFGCGGDRDHGKRAIMGRLAAEKADKIYITNDNPRNEDPEVIIRQILAGISSEYMQYVEVVFSRAEAISRALNSAKAGDTVVIAGKGHETYQKFSDKTVHFDDVEQAEKVLSSMALENSRESLAPISVRMAAEWNRRAINHSLYVVDRAAL